MASDLVTFSPAINDERPQLVDAVKLIVNRHNDGHRATSIVIPPRVGKSNVIRLSALELVQTGVACTTLALVPWENLADQLVNKKKLDEMSAKYPVTAPEISFLCQRIRQLSMNFHELSYVQHLWVSTIQLANSQILILSNWLDRCNSNSEFKHKRPVVFVDEGQMLSHKNEWGGIARLVEEKNAHVILLTGTPYRADRADIPGFKVDEMNKIDIEKVVGTRINDQQVLMRFYKGTSSERVLCPNYEMPLKDAWDLGCLCRVDAQWVNIMLDIKDDDGVVTKTVSLDDMKPTAAQKQLRKASTDEKTMLEMLGRGVSSLAEIRRIRKCESAGMLVITCSDIDDEGQEVDGGTGNWHARLARRILGELDPTLHVVIATQADEQREKSNQGLKRLQNFVNNDIGDVLIVKSMGTVGMDCGRIKVVVLMGTFRQLASWLQAILRGATAWRDIKFFKLVLLEDPLNKLNYEFLIEGQGGSFTVSELEFIKEELLEKEKKDDDIPDISVNSAKVKRAEDSLGKGTTELESVQKLLKIDPELGRAFSTAEIAERILSGIFHVPDEPIKPVSSAKNMGDEKAEFDKAINDASSDYANIVAPKNGTSWDEWAGARRKFLSKAKSACGIPPGMELSRILDVNKLRLLKNWMKEQVAILEEKA